MCGDAIDTTEAFVDLAEQDVAELALLETVPAFADELAEQFANDYCWSQMTFDEIYQRQLLARGGLSNVAFLTTPVPQLHPVRSAA